MNVVGILLGQWNRNSCKVLEQTQHLVVGGVVRNEETEVGVTQDRCYSDETSSATWNDTDVLPGVLACFALAMMCVVELGDGCPEWFDAGSRALIRCQRVNFLRPGGRTYSRPVIVMSME